MKNKFYLLGLLFLLISGNINAQIEQEKLIGAYTYNFARFTTWMNESDIDEFRIVLISKNRDVIHEFEQFAKSRTIKGRNIRLMVLNTPPEEISEPVQIVVMTTEMSTYYDALYKTTEGKCILFVTQDVANKRDVMINLFPTADGKLLFEVNKANIINHNLIVDPEILLLGGTEIDVAELYRNSQRAVEDLQDKLTEMTDSFTILNNQIGLSLAEIEVQKRQIEEQKMLLDDQKQEIEKGKRLVVEYSANVNARQEKIKEQETLLEEHKVSLQNQKEQLDLQQKLVGEQQTEIHKGKHTLDSLTVEISDKNIVLGEQSSIIERQKLVVILAVTAGFMFLLFLVVIILAYRNNLKNSKTLLLQKEEIEKVNRDLKLSNAQLFDTITKLKEAQSQLVSSEKMASLGVLTAGIAHEINNPVNFIYTGINSLKLDMTDLLHAVNEIESLISQESLSELKSKIEEIKNEVAFDEVVEIIQQTIDDIKVGAERTTEIVKGLRNFSRMDKDSMQMYNVHEGIESALLLLKNKYKNHIEIVREYSDLPSIECFAGKLNQVFLNIIGNAIDAIKDKGQITISTHLKDENIVVDISDNGKGIPKDVIDKIFDPFFTTKVVGQGMGLGLSISFGIINEHNGKINVKSEENRGTTFSISLPCNL